MQLCVIDFTCIVCVFTLEIKALARMFGNIYAFMYSMQFFLLFQVKTASEICMSFEAISMPIRPTFSIP
jgi:hypothetical protein